MQDFPAFLKGKKIILGVSGSVAIYKSLEILRCLQKLGAEVRVIMSQKAKDFISPLLFESLSHYQVLEDCNQSWGQNPINHIEIAKWGELFLIAPASANTLNKIAYGIADNVLLEAFLAFGKKKLIAPAANTQMLENKATQRALKILENDGVGIIPTQSKELACKSVGEGALAEPLEIVYWVLRAILSKPFWLNKEVLISGGGSRERIDAVRYLSNFSSGKMAQSLALVAYFLGAKVCYVGSKFPYHLPLGIEVIKTETSESFLKAIQKWQKHKKTKKEDSFLLMCAAISDYIYPKPHATKTKKEVIGAVWDLKLVQNKDILASLDKSKQRTIGFKLENTSEEVKALKNAQKALKEKGLEGICLNCISPSHNPLTSSHNQILWVGALGEKDLGFGDKFTQSFKIFSELETL